MMKYGDTRYAATHHYVSIKKSLKKFTLSTLRWIIDKFIPTPISMAINILEIIYDVINQDKKKRKKARE